MSKATYFATFIIGALSGSAATWYFLKTKYERIAQEEIDSVKEVFSIPKRDPCECEVKPVEEVEDKTDDIMSYSRKLGEEGYVDYSSIEKAVEEVEKPYVISPDDFGELYDYVRISMTLYSDGVLTDDFDEIVEDVENTVGTDYSNHFGEYEDDSVFVRNDRLKCDYEILLDTRKYSDVRKTRPHQLEELYEE